MTTSVELPAPDRTPESEQGRWITCRGCRAMLYAKRLERALRVCPECGHHHRLAARTRLAQLCDPGSVTELDADVASQDVLGFVDTMAYPDRLADARAATGLAEGVLVATAAVAGHRLVCAVLDFAFLGGSLGAAAGELITLAAERAGRDGVPLLLVTASGGARMQEGVLSLMQMAKTSQALSRLDEAGILTIALITDPTYGGVAASFATQCDVTIAEPGARLGFAGPRVIRQTIGGTLPAGFQTAEFLLERGFVDLVVPRSGLRDTLRRLLAAAARPGLLDGIPDGPAPGEVGHVDPEVLVTDPTRLHETDPWTAVRQAREPDRPTTLDHVGRVFRDFVELHGDRLGGDCPAIVGGPARLGDRGVVVVGHQRGATLAELSRRNYGMATPAGYRKAGRLMRLAAKLRLPVVTFVDTPGAHPGPDSEAAGQAVAIAESIKLMSALRTPVISIIIGEGGSGGALALAAADIVLITERGAYSVITPEGCASILWSDPSRAATAARALRPDARNLLATHVVDGVITEPDGGAQADPVEASNRIRAVLAVELARLDRLPTRSLIDNRRARYRAFGPGGRPEPEATP